MTDEARAFWVVEPGRGEIRSEVLRSPADGDVVVQTLFSGISRGTEALVFGGHVPQSEWARMRAPFQEGEFSGAGEVRLRQRRSSGVRTERAEGRTVFVLHPHQTRYVVPASAVHVAAGGRAASESSTRRQPRDSLERRVGRAPADWRPGRGDRCRNGRLPRRVAGVAHRRAATCSSST